MFTFVRNRCSSSPEYAKSKCLLDQAARENDDKKKTALIINAAEMTGIFDSKYGDFNIDHFLKVTCSDLWGKHPNADIFYNDRAVENYKNDPKGPVPVPHLLKISDKSILSVRMDGGLPRSILFDVLDSPICSMAFFGVIQEIRFGSQADYYYDPTKYERTRAFLEANDYVLPENIYQTHYFLVYTQKHLTPIYIEVLMRDEYEGGLTGIFQLINLLQARHGQETAELNSRVGRETDKVDPIDKKYMRKVATEGWWNLDPGPCEGCLVINDYHYGAVHDGLLYNKGKKRYMGVYHADEDHHVLYRSVSDYLDSRFYDPKSFLLLTVFRTYVHDNNMSVNDGLEYELDDMGGVFLTTDGFDFSDFEGSVDEIGDYLSEGTDVELGKYKMYFRCGW